MLLYCYLMIWNCSFTIEQSLQPEPDGWAPGTSQGDNREEGEEESGMPKAAESKYTIAE